MGGLNPFLSLRAHFMKVCIFFNILGDAWYGNAII
jgi:hypothetical protein